MKLVTFSPAGPPGPPRLGAVVNDSVVDLGAASGGDPRLGSMLALARGGPEAMEAARRFAVTVAGAPWVFAAAQVRLHAPVPRPAKNVFCVGLNYRSHIEQNAAALGQQVVVPDVPLFFTKPPTAVVGPGADLLLDRSLTSKLDYEVELAVVLGQGGSWIDEEAALTHVLGFTLVNDVTARDLQWKTSQFFYSKGLDSFCPLGPAVVTPDELGPWEDVVLELTVNGELRQREAAGNMLFSPARAIAELSRGLSLEAGDIVSLGTPGGCGYQLDPPSWLAPGDVVECRAKAIGTLVNQVSEVRRGEGIAPHPQEVGDGI